MCYKEGEYFFGHSKAPVIVFEKMGCTPGMHPYPSLWLLSVPLRQPCDIFIVSMFGHAVTVVISGLTNQPYARAEQATFFISPGI